MILAGGLGTRLRGVVPGLPKALAPVAGRPFVSLLLEHIQRCGGRRVVLALGHKADAVERALGQRYAGEVELVYSREERPAGTGGALALAARLVRTADLVAMNGDSIVLEDLAAVCAGHRAAGADLTMVTVPVPDAGRFGSVVVREDGRVVGIAEKGSAGPGVVNAGIYVMGAGLARGFAVPSSLERDVLPVLVARTVRAHASSRPFIDIGTPESYRRAQEQAERHAPGVRPARRQGQ